MNPYNNKKSTYQISGFAIVILLVLILLGWLFENDLIKIDFQSITLLEGLTTVFITVLIYATIEHLYKKL